MAYKRDFRAKYDETNIRCYIFNLPQSCKNKA